MTMTVFSTDGDCGEILKRHPALAQTRPMRDDDAAYALSVYFEYRYFCGTI